jgi:hypothetical protein
MNPFHGVQWSFEESPCDLCPSTARCRARLEACGQFKSFVAYGGRRWRAAAREPNHERYAKIFRETGEELIAA